MMRSGHGTPLPRSLGCLNRTDATESGLPRIHWHFTQLDCSELEDKNGPSLKESQRPISEMNLSVYDAAYLELALRLKLPLACKDGPLRDAAKKRSLTVVPEKKSGFGNDSG